MTLPPYRTPAFPAAHKVPPPWWRRFLCRVGRHCLHCRVRLPYATVEGADACFQCCVCDTVRCDLGNHCVLCRIAHLYRYGTKHNTEHTEN